MATGKSTIMTSVCARAAAYHTHTGVQSPLGADGFPEKYHVPLKNPSAASGDYYPILSSPSFQCFFSFNIGMRCRCRVLGNALHPRVPHFTQVMMST